MSESDHVIAKSPIPPELMIEIPDLHADNVLDVTTKIRYQMLRQYLTNGQLPADPKEASIVVKLLDGLDKQDLTKKKLDIEEKGVSTNNEIAKASLALVRHFTGTTNVNPYEQAPSTAVKAPTLDVSLTADIEITEGEKSLSPRDFSKDV